MIVVYCDSCGEDVAMGNSTARITLEVTVPDLPGGETSTFLHICLSCWPRLVQHMAGRGPIGHRTEFDIILEVLQHEKANPTPEVADDVS